MPQFLGIDFGTSGCRAVLIDHRERRITGFATPLDAPHHDGPRSEQAAGLWWTALQECLVGLARQHPLTDVAALAVDGTSGSLLLCTRDGRPLTPALMYDDTGAAAEVKQIRQAGGRGAVASATSALAKALHLTQELDPAGQDVVAAHQADWIAGQLCGRFGISDVNNALKLGFDAAGNAWPDWLDRLEMDRRMLPAIVAVGTDLGPVTQGAARSLGLPGGTRIIAGTTDSTASAIAAGACRPGDAVTVLGSTLVTKILTEIPISDETSGVYSHRFGDLWLAGGASNSGGAVLAAFFTEARLCDLESQLRPDEPTGLDYYPLLRPGERFPINDPHLAARLTPRPDSDVRFLQGLLEGIADIEAAAYRRLRDLGCPTPRRILTIGGGARNQAWRRIREKLSGIHVETAPHQEAAYGAALVAKRRGIG